MADRSENVTWHPQAVEGAARARITGQRGAVVWLTGLSGSGKSTLAMALERRLVCAGHAACVLDGDNLRHGLNGDLGFQPADRAENIRRVGHVAALMADAGLVCAASFVSPYRADRAAAAAVIGPTRFFEVFVDVPLAVCEARDPKGLYARARSGALRGLTGVDAPYEPPEAPGLRLDGTAPLGSLVDALERALRAAGHLGRGRPAGAPHG